jgi:Protein of unknown function (DUF3147)
VLPELAIRFVLGGVIVSAFAVIGDILHPKSFAGIFGAAPSVALASLALAFLTNGIHDATVDGHAMVLGAIALCAFSWAVARLLLRYKRNTIVATAASWLGWLAVAFGLWAITLR